MSCRKGDVNEVEVWSCTNSIADELARLGASGGFGGSICTFSIEITPSLIAQRLIHDADMYDVCLEGERVV
jgi:hypothetical protein